MFFAPKIEESPIAEGHVLGRIDPKTGCSAIDPFRLAFEFRKVADRRFIHHAMPFAVTPFGAPFFITKCFDEAKRSEDALKRVAVAHFALRLDAVLVPVFTGSSIGQAFVGHDAAVAIVPDTEDLGSRAHGAPGRVIENVALELARCLEAESRGCKPLRKPAWIAHPKFDFRFDRHGT